MDGWMGWMGLCKREGSVGCWMLNLVGCRMLGGIWDMGYGDGWADVGRDMRVMGYGMGVSI